MRSSWKLRQYFCYDTRTKIVTKVGLFTIVSNNGVYLAIYFEMGISYLIFSDDKQKGPEI